MDAGSTNLVFSDIARELSPALLRYLERYTGERAAAEDLLQESLLRISRGLASYQGRAALKTWAYAIATRVAADYFRSPARGIAIVATDAATEQVPDGEPRIDERIVVDEMNACVRQVIDGLPQDYRAALVLHDLEGLGAGEVAEVCGCSLATAKMRIHRARLRLKRALEKQCEFYRDADDVLRCDRKT
jgi:RNA polymerase sigma-70 factor (ECF subfamily)